jgi:hypothetical protein
MAKDVFTEVTHQGLGRRLGASFKGIFFGLLMFLVAFPLLFWNEGRAVKRYKSLVEGQGLVVSIQASEPQAQHQGALVHFSGMASSDELLTDELFGIQSNGLRLQRVVEMYQWDESSRTETKTNTGGSQTKTTTYEYDRKWSSSTIDSSQFKQPDGHRNPGTMPFSGKRYVVSDARVGAVVLPNSLVERIGGAQGVSAQGATIAAGPSRGQVIGDYVFYGESSGAPKVGDVRVSFRAVPETTVSIIAKLEGASVLPFTTSVGGDLFMIENGALTAEAMFADAQRSNTMITWLIRGGGFLLMFIGLSSLLGPLRVFSDIIPFFGRIVGMGIGLVAGVLAFMFSGVTIAIAWFAYRPLLSLGIIAVSAVALFLLRGRGKGEEVSVASPAAGGPPPPPPS